MRSGLRTGFVRPAVHPARCTPRGRRIECRPDTAPLPGPTMSTPATPAPTRVRYTVLGFVCALAMVTYLDRFAFGASTSYFINALGLTSIADLKVAMTAWAIAYALFEIPGGWLGDRYGPRGTLIRIVLWWSFFVILMGAVGLEVDGVVVLGYVTALAVIQFLFGMGQAGGYPNITRALHNWFPLAERGVAQGVVWMFSRAMGGLTPLVWVVLVERLHLYWRHAF